MRLVALPLESRIEPHHIIECVASSRLLPRSQVMVSGICCIRDRGEDRRTRKSRLPPFSRGHLVHCCSAVVVVVTGTGVGRLTSIDTRHVQHSGLSAARSTAGTVQTHSEALLSMLSRTRVSETNKPHAQHRQSCVDEILNW